LAYLHEESNKIMHSKAAYNYLDDGGVLRDVNGILFEG